MSLNKRKTYIKYLLILGVFIGLGLSIPFFKNYIVASGEPADPKKTITDASGIDRRNFISSETAYLTLRNYSELLAAQKSKADIELVIDLSGSMAGDKFVSLKAALTNFVNSIDLDDEMQVGLVQFRDTGKTKVLRTLTLINGQNDKDKLLNDISNLEDPSGGTSMGKGVALANADLISKQRADANHYVVLFTDGAETVAPYVNGEGFKETQNNDRNYRELTTSALRASINAGTKFFTISFGGAAGAACPAVVDPGPNVASFSCPMMRFVAARTNAQPLPETVTTWSSDYGTVTGVDDNFFYKSASANDLKDVYSKILSLIQSSNGVVLDIYEKLDQNVEFVSVDSAKDKGGRSYSIKRTDLNNNYNKFKTAVDVDGVETLVKIPARYYCANNEAACKENAKKVIVSGVEKFLISDNYLDLKLKVKMKDEATGSFDIDSNYTNCESGVLKQVGSDSKVDYIDPRNKLKYTSKIYPALCIKLTRSNPIIKKSSFKDDPGDDLNALSNPMVEPKTSFEAGDDVWVVLEIEEPANSRGDYKLNDRVPISVNSLSEYSFYNGNTKVCGKSNCPAISISNGQIIFNNSGDLGSLKYGKNFIKYKYKI